MEAQVGQQGQEQNKYLRSCCCSCSKGQAQIARETREGLQKLAEGLQKSSTRPGMVDVKGIGKPHEEVQKQWKPWSYKFETWFCSQWPTGQQVLDYARRKWTTLSPMWIS